jgi:hypothetical protein
MLTQRTFSSGGHHGHDDHGHGHGHHQHVNKAAPDHKFLKLDDKTKKFMVLNNLPSAEPESFQLTNAYQHHNDLPLSQ